jgi:hypothetical protein
MLIEPHISALFTNPAQGFSLTVMFNDEFKFFRRRLNHFNTFLSKY